MAAPEDVLSFWLDEKKPSDWYASDKGLDQEIRDRFEATWNEAMQGKFGLWLTYPNGALAYIILMDQFSRNMFRGTSKAFASDKAALAAAKVAIDRNWDMRVDEPARQFFYMPLMHSESLCDQERCIRLMKERMPKTGESNLLHAQAHREVNRKFGRFPYRNEALARKFTDVEQDYVANGGYSSTVRELQSVSA
ncbi:DUF924 family protein [Planktotalea sp.]|uniref:DUF924 family protein n=1 Tax=Planktotalea sp. TaxID=2029877 RepID=UPI0032993C7C